MHRHTLIRRGHCPGGGRLVQNTRTAPSAAKRSAVNRKGGISCSAIAEVRKLPAHAKQISRTREISRGDMRAQRIAPAVRAGEWCCGETYCGKTCAIVLEATVPARL